MQFSRILFNLVTRHVAVLICFVFILINVMFYTAAKDDHLRQINAQFQYTNQMINLSLPLEIVKPLSPVILEWQFITPTGYTKIRKIFGKSWNVASTKFEVEDGYVLLVHQSLVSAYFFQFFITNTVLFFIVLTLLTTAHFNLQKHWKVLIQLESWAARYDKNDKFRFYLSSRSYSLVNTIRNLNQARIEAQKSGHKADHFIRSQTFWITIQG
ncbi:hypothetical protein RT723_11935 [Psychrosphaera aquimarina]|uniref:Uncharacterized protein n=1 Tax=Psychrosphaera aquimarina TaxID=2044854 RepID=A0ABU3R1Z0_9GAMM|nr:hypothetical protein [Psychrosphaera aquimarina]MDU0113695.1 hypothetical protein [Psychrosphaera aquimarina]